MAFYRRRAERFGELYRIGKARIGFTEEQISKMIGFKGRPPLLERRRNPEKLSLGQLITLGHAFNWSEAKYKVSVLQYVARRLFATMGEFLKIELGQALRVCD